MAFFGFTKSLSYRTGVIVLLCCIPFYIKQSFRKSQS